MLVPLASLVWLLFLPLPPPPPFLPLPPPPFLASASSDPTADPARAATAPAANPRNMPRRVSRVVQTFLSRSSKFSPSMDRYLSLIMCGLVPCRTRASTHLPRPVERVQEFCYGEFTEVSRSTRETYTSHGGVTHV